MNVNTSPRFGALVLEAANAEEIRLRTTWFDRLSVEGKKSDYIVFSQKNTQLEAHAGFNTEGSKGSKLKTMDPFTKVLLKPEQYQRIWQRVKKAQIDVDENLAFANTPYAHQESIPYYENSGAYLGMLLDMKAATNFEKMDWKIKLLQIIQEHFLNLKKN
jgi:hypothetical protein